jgi:hypothetical protein
VVIQGNSARRRDTQPQRMQAKAIFWLGIVLCGGAIWFAVDAGSQWAGHLFGGVLALAGVVIALRNVRA